MASLASVEVVVRMETVPWSFSRSVSMVVGRDLVREERAIRGCGRCGWIGGVGRRWENRNASVIKLTLHSRYTILPARIVFIDSGLVHETATHENVLDVFEWT
jgi:hypothetical protein